MEKSETSVGDISEPLLRYLYFPMKEYLPLFLDHEYFTEPLKVLKPLQMSYEKSENFVVTYASKIVITRVAPGMSVAFNVKFHPDDQRDYETIGSRPLFDIPDHIYVPTSPVRVPATKLIVIRNIGETKGVFDIITESPFTVEPKEGILGAQEVMQVIITCMHNEVGEFEKPFVLKYETGEKLYATVHGSAENVNVFFENSEMWFEDTYTGLTRQCSIILYNQSEHLIPYKLKESYKYVQEIEILRSTKVEVFEVADQEAHSVAYERIYEDELKSLETDDFLFNDSVFVIDQLVIAFNKGHIPGTISFVNQEFIFGGKLSCEPLSHRLEPEECKSFALTFSSNRRGEFYEDIIFQIKESSEKVKLILQGSVITPTLHFSTKCIQWGDVAVEDHQAFSDLTNTNKIFTTKQKEYHVTCCFDALENIQNGPDFRITLVANVARKKETDIMVDMWDSKTDSLSLPVSFNAKYASIVCLPENLDIKFCFINCQYNRTITLQNLSKIPGYFIIVPQELRRSAKIPSQNTILRWVNSVCATGSISKKKSPGRTRIVRWSSKCRDSKTVLRLPQLSARKHVVALRILLVMGDKHPVPCCTVTCNGQGPVLSVEPKELMWGETSIVKQTTKELFLLNDSPIPATFQCIIKSGLPWSVDPSCGSVLPAAKCKLTVFLYLRERSLVKGILEIHLENGKTTFVPLSAKGIGLCIEVDPPCIPKIDLNVLYSTIFSVHPHTIILDPDECTTVTLEAQYDSVGEVVDKLYLFASDGKSRKIIQDQTTILARFIEPIIKFSKPEIILFANFGVEESEDHLEGKKSFPVKGEVNYPNVSLIPKQIDLGCIPAGTVFCDHVLLTNVSHLPVNFWWYWLSNSFKVTMLEPVEGCVPPPELLEHEKLVEPCAKDEETASEKIIFSQILNVSEVTLADIEEARKLKEASKIFSAKEDGEKVRDEKVIEEKKIKEDIDNKKEVYLNPIPEIDKLLPTENEKDLTEKPSKDKKSKVKTKQKVTNKKEQKKKKHSPTEDSEKKSESGLETITESESIPTDIEDIVCADDEAKSLSPTYGELKDKLFPLIDKYFEPALDLDIFNILPNVAKKDTDIDEVFEIAPSFGKLNPNSLEYLTISYCGDKCMSAEVTAMCKVEGGPSEKLTVKAMSTNLTYYLDYTNIDFGNQVFCEVCQRTITLYNTGYMEFDFLADAIEPPIASDAGYIFQAGMLIVEPRSGHVNSKSNVQLSVSYVPGISGRFKEEFNLESKHTMHRRKLTTAEAYHAIGMLESGQRQIGYLLPITINVEGNGVFPQLYVLLPHFQDPLLPVEIGYAAVASLTELQSPIECSSVTKEPSLSSNHNAYPVPDTDLLGLLSEDDWVILMDNECYPAVHEIDLAIERLLAYKHIEENPHELLRYTTIKSFQTIPNFSVPPYVLDFGLVIVDTTVFYTVHLYNYGPVPINVRKIDHGARIPILIQAVVTLPFLTLSTSLLEFGIVKCGECKSMPLILKNDGLVPCKWQAFLAPLKKSNTKKSTQRTIGGDSIVFVDPAFSIKHEEDIFYPNMVAIVEVFFQPKKSGTSQTNLVLSIDQNPDTFDVIVRGAGIEPCLKIDTVDVNFPPVLPYPEKCEQVFHIENPCPFPVEILFCDFDSCENYDPIKDALISTLSPKVSDQEMSTKANILIVFHGAPKTVMDPFEELMKKVKVLETAIQMKKKTETVPTKGKKVGGRASSAVNKASSKRGQQSETQIHNVFSFPAETLIDLINQR
ncbi:hypothetical protein C0J52_12906 [Blattella germanica]|nr:hypothetical protein C0J52_12906 [Blattella germanica]